MKVTIVVRDANNSEIEIPDQIVLNNFIQDVQSEQPFLGVIVHGEQQLINKNHIIKIKWPKQ